MGHWHIRMAFVTGFSINFSVQFSNHDPSKRHSGSGVTNGHESSIETSARSGPERADAAIDLTPFTIVPII